MSPRKKILIGLVSALCFIGAYTYLSHWQHQRIPDDTTIPSWSQLAAGIEKMVEVNPRDGERWLVVDTSATLSRFFLGLLLAIVGSLFFGIMMGRFEAFEAFWGPPLSVLAKVPPTAALAAFFVMVGTDLEMYVAMIAFGVLPTMAQSVYLSVRDVPLQVINKARTLGASGFEVIGNVITPQIFPKCIDAVRLQIGPAMVYLIAAEMVCASEGFGYRIRIQFKKLDMDVVYPYLLALALFGFAMDYLLRVMQRRSCRWYQPARGA